MKKTKSKNIIILIVLIILIIVMIRAFIKSRANNVVEITANFKDNNSLLSDEVITLEAINEGESGYSITLPDIINTKRVGKYIITQKEITESTEENSTVDILPGEKIYLTSEEFENLQVSLVVEYDFLEIGTQTLYNKKLIKNDSEDYELLSVSGYMFYDTELQVNETDITNVENKMVDNYPNSVLFGNYDIKLISDSQEYNAKEYGQTLDIKISTNDENSEYRVLEIQDGDIQELSDVLIENGKIKFSVENLQPYLVLQDNKVELLELDSSDDNTTNDEQIDTNDSGVVSYSVGGEEARFSIDDFETDKNYYLGLNYTEGMSKTNSGKYTENSLKDVEINYYGYDYNLTEFVVPETYNVTLNASAQRTSTGNVTQSGNGGNRTYSRTDTITCTVSGINNLKQQYSGFKANSSWTMKMAVPNNNFSNYFYSTGTDNANSSKGIAVSVSNGIITVTGGDASSLEDNSDTWTFTFYVTFRNNNRSNINNTSFNTLSVNSFETTITLGDYTPYGTISDTEQQTVVSYRKCVPIDSNGNITINLIDNPFMNRPLEKGFNGWKTNNTKYLNSINTNANTFAQTLNTNINNITDNSGKYVIDLYADWIDANVIFVSSSGSSSNSGTSPNTPINNNWSNINSRLNSNIKTCTKASNREVNIVVLMNGTLDVSGLTGPNTPYTLTSLYNGTNYGNSSTYLNVGTSNTQLDSDLQIDYLYVSSNKSYSSPSGTTDGTSLVTPCIYGNMYNLRIGRGVEPTNNNYCTWGQIQGGYYNHSSSEYRLLIESGKYYTTQLYRAYYDSNGRNTDTGATTNTAANATIVVGCDIDRKNRNNDNLKIYNRMASRTNTADCSAYTTNSSAINMIIKSGTIGIDFFNNASTSDSSERNYAGIYVGGHGTTGGYDKSDRYLLVEGGNIANIIGGLKVSEDDMFKTYMYVKDGNVINITGGAGYTHTYGDRIIQVTGGYIKYSISGGSNGVAASSDTNNGQLTGTSLIYIGGNAQIGASSTIDSNGNETVSVTNSDEKLYGVNAGCVCGGANGNSSYAGQTDASYIIIDGNAIIHNNVFGGGNYGIIGSTNIKGPDVVKFNDETSNFRTDTEYLITTTSSGGNGLTINGNSLENETITTSAKPSNSTKWLFEQSSGNKYYIKNVDTGQYIYINSTSGSWRYIYFKCNIKYK